MKPTKIGTLSVPSLLIIIALAIVILSACGGSDDAQTGAGVDGTAVIDGTAAIAARWSQGPSPCEPSSETQAAASGQFARQIEGAVPDDIGKVRISFNGDGQQNVIVFEENHASRAGQIELAIILNRLYHRHGVRHLALEGAVLEEQPPNAAWFHELPDEAVRRQVSVQLLEKGEISAAEFAAMVFTDFQLHPIERQDEYKVKLPSDARGAFNTYLYAIAVESMDSGKQRAACMPVPRSSKTMAIKKNTTKNYESISSSSSLQMNGQRAATIIWTVRVGR